jgi:hypothetical protein
MSNLPPKGFAPQPPHSGLDAIAGAVFRRGSASSLDALSAKGA